MINIKLSTLIIILFICNAYVWYWLGYETGNLFVDILVSFSIRFSILFDKIFKRKKKIKKRFSNTEYSVIDKKKDKILIKVLFVYNDGSTELLKECADSWDKDLNMCVKYASLYGMKPKWEKYKWTTNLD